MKKNKGGNRPRGFISYDPFADMAGRSGSTKVKEVQGEISDHVKALTDPVIEVGTPPEPPTKGSEIQSNPNSKPESNQEDITPNQNSQTSQKVPQYNIETVGEEDFEDVFDSDDSTRSMTPRGSPIPRGRRNRKLFYEGRELVQLELKVAEQTQVLKEKRRIYEEKQKNNSLALVRFI